MRLRQAFVFAFVLVTTFVASAPSAFGATSERKISASVVRLEALSEDVCANCGPNGTPIVLQGCNWMYVVQFANVAGAISYQVAVYDAWYKTTTTHTGPPFPYDVWPPFPPASGHRIGLSSGGGAAPCSTSDEGRFEVRKAVATFDDKLRIAGTVRGKDGAPASGVRIAASGAGSGSATTDASGGYAMLVPRTGAYTVRAAGPWCADGVKPCAPKKTIQVRSGTSTLNFQRERDYELSGEVVRWTCSEDRCASEAMSGVTIQASPGALTATTDEQGKWKLEAPRGTYTVRASSPETGFEPDQRRVEVERDVDRLDFDACRSEEAPGDEPAARLRSLEDEAGRKCALTLDWEVPNRLYRTAGELAANGLPPVKGVYPASWNAELFTSRNGNRASCDAGERYRWSITAPANVRGAKVLVPRTPVPGCSVKVVVTELGNYRIRAEREVRRGGTWVRDESVAPLNGTLRLRDWLVIGVGDSNGSGEGNPATFNYRRCNRGFASYQYQTAKYLEEQDRRTSVTFIHTSCSGARVEHFVDKPYEGTREENLRLPAQSQQVLGLLEANGNHPRRKVDAAITSLGVNDIAFGPILIHCVKYGTHLDPCLNQRVRTTLDVYGFPDGLIKHPAGTPLHVLLERLQNGLEARFTTLPAAMRRLGVKPDRVFMANYPDWAHGDDGLLCNELTSTFTAVDWEQDTWGMFSTHSRILNGHVMAVADRRNFVNVPVSQQAWAMRGYCSSNSLAVGLIAAALRDDRAGPFHPNVEAHQIAAAVTSKLLCAKLYKGNEECVSS